MRFLKNIFAIAIGLLSVGPAVLMGVRDETALWGIALVVATFVWLFLLPTRGPKGTRVQMMGADGGLTGFGILIWLLVADLIGTTGIWWLLKTHPGVASDLGTPWWQCMVGVTVTLSYFYAHAEYVKEHGRNRDAEAAADELHNHLIAAPAAAGVAAGRR